MLATRDNYPQLRGRWGKSYFISSRMLRSPVAGTSVAAGSGRRSTSAADASDWLQAALPPAKTDKMAALALEGNYCKAGDSHRLIITNNHSRV